jgi:acetyl-CoA synthetase (ADP-forming)
MRIIGPNCLGIYDNISRVDTFFIPRELVQRPGPGAVSIASQSGSFVGHLMDLASFEGLGIARVINYGNKIDVDEADALYYFTNDPNTNVVCLYIEAVSEGRRFLEAAKYCSGKKPLIILKAAKHEVIAKAQASHTGTLAGSYASYKSAFRKAGAIEVNSELEMLDLCKAISTLPRPSGKRVLIVGHAGGLGLMVADLCIELGLVIPEISGELEKALKNRVLGFASVKNPIDLTASGTDEHAHSVLKSALVESDVADMAIYLALWGLPQNTDRIGEILLDVMTKSCKPVIVATLQGKKCFEKRSVFESKGIPVFFSMERAARVAKRLAETTTQY